MNNAPAEGLRLTDRQRLNWLRLIRADNVGPATFRDLVNRFGSAEAAVSILPELSARGGGSRHMRIPTEADAQREMETAHRFGARFVAIGEPDYPPLLQRADQPPPLVAIAGDSEILRAPAVAIVGARNASAAGTRFAASLASELGRAGYTVVSGLARGIDAAAHRGSLATGTVAVLAGGLDRPYPQENVALAEEVAQRGVLVSQMPFGWEPRARDFPRRNRLVAGMSLGLVVVEAAFRSGSLISARLANEMGRVVFAVPGSPLDPRAAGSNGLLKQGATIVTEASDVLDMLAPMAGVHRPAALPLEEPPDFNAVPPPADSERNRVLEALGPTPMPVDDIIRHTGLHPAQVFVILLELDLAGRLERHAGSAVSLLPPDS